jgi:hypothetical protein
MFGHEKVLLRLEEQLENDMHCSFESLGYNYFSTFVTWFLLFKIV